MIAVYNVNKTANIREYFAKCTRYGGQPSSLFYVNKSIRKNVSLIRLVGRHRDRPNIQNSRQQNYQEKHTEARENTQPGVIYT